MENAFQEKKRRDPITGEREWRGAKSKLNSNRKLTPQEMDEIFLDEEEW
jgi:hypothetical protein